MHQLGFNDYIIYIKVHKHETTVPRLISLSHRYVHFPRNINEQGLRDVNGGRLANSSAVTHAT